MDVAPAEGLAPSSARAVAEVVNARRAEEARMRREWCEAMRAAGGAAAWWQQVLRDEMAALHPVEDQPYPPRASDETTRSSPASRSMTDVGS